MVTHGDSVSGGPTSWPSSIAFACKTLSGALCHPDWSTSMLCAICSSGVEISTAIAPYVIILSLWKISTQWFLFLAPREVFPADSNIRLYFVTFIASLCLVMGDRVGLRIWPKSFLKRDILPDGVTNSFVFFQVPTLAITVSLLSGIFVFSNTISLSLPNLSCAGVWTKKPYGGCWHV